MILGACGSTTDGANGNGTDGAVTTLDGAPPPDRLAAPIHPDASCFVEIASPPIEGQTHVPEGTPVTYGSNPPSSGNHYPIWANFQEYSTPVPDGYLVHSEEHGAVLLLYNCALPTQLDADAGGGVGDDDAGGGEGGADDDGGGPVTGDDAGPALTGCAATLEGMRAIRDAIPDDLSCDPNGAPPVRVRVIIAPDPELDVPVAAAAWGWTYRANCFDEPTLAQFVNDHYAQGPEQLCAPGKTIF